VGASEVRYWNEAEVNFFRRIGLSRRDYLDYLKNQAKSGDMAVTVLQNQVQSLNFGKEIQLEN